MNRRDAHLKLADRFPHAEARPSMRTGEAYMFATDIHTGVMPISARAAKHQDFTATLSGDDTSVEEAKSLLASLGSFDRHDLREGLCDAVNDIAQALAWSGRSVFELSKGRDGKICLFPIPNRGLFFMPTRLLQIIPKVDREYWKRSVSFVNSNTVWRLDMPPALGGARGHRRLLAELEAAESSGPKFWLDAINDGRAEVHFNFKDYRRERDILIRSQTKAWGWNARDWNSELATEFYTFHRAIRFRIAQAVLREHIVYELNGLFARLKLNVVLDVSGLPTPKEIRKLLREMSEGSIFYGKVFELTSL